MKNKRITKFLLPVVLVLWAVIGWKVYAAMGGGEETVIAHSAEATHQPESSLPDSLPLIADYRDPFLEKMAVKREVKTGSQQALPLKVKAEPVVKIAPSWPKVNYYGLVKRNGDQKTVGFLSVEGASSFVQAGDVVGEVKVLRLWKDSVEVGWGKERRVVRE